jgi:hypothetical protein
MENSREHLTKKGPSACGLGGVGGTTFTVKITACYEMLHRALNMVLKTSGPLKDSWLLNKYSAPWSKLRNI